MMNTQQIKIEQPCPISLLAMKKVGDNYQCKHCSKVVIDFRKMSQDEVERRISSDICGIFNSYQLPAQIRPSWSMRIRFMALAIGSVLGFQVRVSAQTTPKQTQPVAQKQVPKQTGKEPLPVCPRPAPQKDTIAPEPKKPVFRTIGCPSF